jgi:hypothetical protein
MAHTKDAGGRDRPPKIRITVIIQNRYTFDTEVATGTQIREMAKIPEGFALHRRIRGGNESIPDDDSVELHDGDHFFARRESSPARSDEGREVST